MLHRWVHWSLLDFKTFPRDSQDLLVFLLGGTDFENQRSVPSDVHQFVCRLKKINFPPDGKWALNLLKEKTKHWGEEKCECTVKTACSGFFFIILS